jgi:SAM-dependent methyltransferase
MKDRTIAQNLAAEHLAQGDPTGWFEPLYAAAGGDAQNIPWADLEPNIHLVSWLDAHTIRGDGKRALVVGCGLGDDAEELARRGFNVTAFDISPTAIAWCRKRFPTSRVAYRAADALHPPAEWVGAFDFIHESYTLQAIPVQPRYEALKGISKLVAPEGTLLVICRGSDAGDEEPLVPPWPLTRDELLQGVEGALVETSFEDFIEDGDPPIRRFRIVLTREA